VGEEAYRALITKSKTNITRNLTVKHAMREAAKKTRFFYVEKGKEIVRYIERLNLSKTY
jgi:hypothetical protein